MKSSDLPYRQYICRACGLIYDEAEGDPDSGLAPGTRFEDIPDEWECPLCKVTKADFELFEKRQPTTAPKQHYRHQQTGIVVVGGGLAGWSVIESIRELDPAVSITLVCACTGDRYHKPELSLALGRKLTVKKLIRESAQAAAQRLNIALLTKTFAVGLNATHKQLRTTRGTLKYTHLVLAQGASPQLPKALPPEQCWRINDLRSWQGLAEQLNQKPQKVAILGAGMIGCELAEDITKAGHTVTLIDRNTYPLSHLLPEKAGNRLLKSLQAQGIRHLSNTNLQHITAQANGQRLAHFDDGTTEVFDQVIVATGLQTENRLANLAGLHFDRGIVVDPQTLQTSAEDIYALGDCISLDGQLCRFIEPIAHQARAITQNILGITQAEPYQHKPPVIRLKTQSLPVLLRGTPQPELDWATTVENDRELVMEQRLNDKLVAQLQLHYRSQHQAA